MVKRLDSAVRVIVFVTMLVSSSAFAAEVNSSRNSIGLEAEVDSGLQLRFRVSNNSDDEITLYGQYFRPPMLKLVVVDAHGDVLRRVAWTGDVVIKPEVIPPASTNDFALNLPKWYPELAEIAETECLVLFWSVELHPEELLNSRFFGGAIQLNCVGGAPARNGN